MNVPPDIHVVHARYAQPLAVTYCHLHVSLYLTTLHPHFKVQQRSNHPLDRQEQRAKMSRDNLKEHDSPMYAFTYARPLCPVFLSSPMLLSFAPVQRFYRSSILLSMHRFSNPDGKNTRGAI